MSESTTATTALALKLEQMERSQGWLAGQLRVTRQSISPWVRGEEAVPKARQAQIGLTLGVKPSELFSDDYARPLQEESRGG